MKTPSIHEVTDQIYVGSQSDSRRLRVNNAEIITAILDCTGDSYEPPPGIGLCTLGMPDNSEFDTEIVWRGLDFIRQAVSDGGKVLVHCRGGVSRSRALVAAYLVLHHRMSWQEAKAEVYRKRPVRFGINKKTEATVLRALAEYEAAQQA